MNTSTIYVYRPACFKPTYYTQAAHLCDISVFKLISTYYVHVFLRGVM